MAATKENGYAVLKILYAEPLKQKELQELGVDSGTLESLVGKGLILNIDKTHSQPIYKLTRQGQQYVEQITSEQYENGKRTINQVALT